VNEIRIIASVDIEDLLRRECDLLQMPNIVGKDTVRKTSEKLTSKVRSRFQVEISFSDAEEFVQRRLLEA